MKDHSHRCGQGCGTDCRLSWRSPVSYEMLCDVSILTAPCYLMDQSDTGHSSRLTNHPYNHCRGMQRTVKYPAWLEYHGMSRSFCPTTPNQEDAWPHLCRGNHDKTQGEDRTCDRRCGNCCRPCFGRSAHHAAWPRESKPNLTEFDSPVHRNGMPCNLTQSQSPQGPTRGSPCMTHFPHSPPWPHGYSSMSD